MPLEPSRPPRRFLVPALATLVLVALILAIAARFAPWELAVGNLVLRSQQGIGMEFPAPASGELIEAERREAPVEAAVPGPLNVILMIGDGMGVGQVSTASAILRGPAGALVMESAPVTGLMRTHAGNHLVTDSAASSTAMATGFKAPKKAISVLSDGRVPVTLFEAARAAGVATGLVTTSGLVDATPAGFTAHEVKREHYAEILDDMLASDSEVLLGGDWSDFPKALRNEAFQQRIAGIDTLAEAAGYEVARDLAGLKAARGPVLGWFPPRGGHGDAHGPALAETTMLAVERLAATGTGFLLLVESEVTDSTGHDNDIASLVAGIAELDAALAAILDWAAPRGDTLVLVTADHDTGGVGIVDGAYEESLAEVRWATTGHTAQWVPLFAFGPGAEEFSGVIDNTEIGVRIAELLGITGFPGIRP